MREIKFRGRRLDGAWCYGSLYMAFGEIHAPNDIPIICSIIDLTGHHHPVEPKTIEQFTGLHDKNGKEIYEGDVVSGYSFMYRSPFEVKWEDGADDVYIWHGYTLDGSDVEVIGNIHENPELLNAH